MISRFHSTKFREENSFWHIVWRLRTAALRTRSYWLISPLFGFSIFIMRQASNMSQPFMKLCLAHRSPILIQKTSQVKHSMRSRVNFAQIGAMFIYKEETLLELTCSQMGCIILQLTLVNIWKLWLEIHYRQNASLRRRVSLSSIRFTSRTRFLLSSSLPQHTWQMAIRWIQSS